ncbi:Serine/threonine-protein phosphatase 6 regulatory ankyrin repeat subunit C [Colletotrichum orbiculare MAFF 240422]|uniref:Serine/threonine-protein phosphatase 6 regulatory ankyrin repeat subunit C n=1 Tax=Colletotrichum orbiculare (strain 104-T / ATCC 96160 / CBS 514.97 / LARS 414 / MAFF 240422) TaxID=1213857 RepID=A0A484F9X1_COLOR|nr:Serine/threonine-protein phosphatase 6 regulatory ankyrin repeat subunit C [Colletotrichum orbiculare MAFF 240422]
MEVVGATASFIAISQALIAGRHVVNLLQEIPKMSGALISLNNDIETIRSIIAAAEEDSTDALRDGPEPLALRTARLQLLQATNDLQEILRRCTKTVDKDGKLRARKLKLFFTQKPIEDCRDKLRDAKGNLMLALQVLNLKISGQITLQIQAFRLVSSSDFQPAGACNKTVGCDTTFQGSSATISDHLTAEESDAAEITAEELVPKMDQMMVATMSKQTSDSSSSLANEVLVFKAKLALRYSCPRPCVCRCHASRPVSYRSAHWAQGLIGSLSVAFDRGLLFGGEQECSERKCKGNKRKTASFNYQFPTWLCSQYLSIHTTLGTFVRPSASLRPVKHIPGTDVLWGCLEYRTRTELQTLMLNNGPIYPNDVGYSGYSVLELAINYASADTLEFLLGLWQDYLDKGNADHKWLFEAQSELRHGSPEKAQLCKRIISWTENDVNAMSTPLHEAILDDFDCDCANFEERIAELGRKFPWALEQWNLDGETPVHAAVRLGKTAVVRALLRVGCNIDQQGWHDDTALILAVRYGHAEVARILVDSGCSINFKGQVGRSPLHRAANSLSYPDENPGHFVRMLLDAGASPSAKDDRGQTAVFRVRGHTKEAVNTKLCLLLDAGVDINGRDYAGSMPIQRAVVEQNDLLTECLVDNGAEVNHVGRRNQSLLHLLAYYGGVTLLGNLEKMDLPLINVEHRDNFGDTPWDDFIISRNAPAWKLGTIRRPSADEEEAFISLYTKTRNRSLQLDIDRLDWARQYLVDSAQRKAEEALKPLIEEKEEWRMEERLQTYKTIRIQVQQGMWEAALESVDENIDLLREKMEQSPWDQESKYDHMWSDTESDWSADEDCETVDSESDEQEEGDEVEVTDDDEA